MAWVAAANAPVVLQVQAQSFVVTRQMVKAKITTKLFASVTELSGGAQALR
jgi:hypothetical protein